MIAGVIVSVAAQDVEHEPFVQLVQRRPRRVEAAPDDFRQVFMAGVTRASYRDRNYPPAFAGPCSSSEVKAGRNLQMG